MSYSRLQWRETEFMHALEGISTDKTMKTFFGNTLTRLCDSSGRFFLYDIACRRVGIFVLII